jgi:hypothetical protein
MEGIDMEQRTCSKCGETKPHSEFYKQAGCRDGVHPHCKSCKRASARASREANIDRVRAYDKERYYSQPGRAAANRASAKASHRRDPWYPRNVEKALAARRERAIREPEKERARSALRHAVDRGEIESEGCLFCDATPAEGHHHDYSKPLGVTWLCVKHHGLVHRKVNEPVRPT